MNIIDGIKGRRSVRKFREDNIPRETIEKIVEAASFAPSWKNTQITRYIVIENEEVKSKIAEKAVLGFTFNEKTIKRAPVIALQTFVKGVSGFEADGSYSTPKGSGWEMYDAGLSAEAFCLAAHSYGIGTVILGYVDDAKIKELIDIPSNQEVAAIIAMGYHDTDNNAPKRLPVGELLNFVE
ncbi:MAG: nitroreductase family protein [Eubacterium sp.]|nr:nitroreductase family protein [Eubacterium sp.]